MGNLKYKILIIIQCLIFGFSFIGIKKLCLLNVPSFLLISIRFLIGSIALFTVSLIFNKISKTRWQTAEVRKLKKEELLYGVVAGGSMFTAFAFQTLGAATTTPAKNALFTDLCIIFTPLIGGIINKKLALQSLLSSFIAVVGVLFILQIFQEEPSFSIGDGLSIICGVAFSVHFILLERFAQRSNNKLNLFNFTIVQFSVTAVLSIMFSLLFEIKCYSQIMWAQTIIWFLYVGIFASAIAYVLQFIAQVHISANDTSLLSSFEALFTLIFALIFKFDNFSWDLIIGTGVLLIAFILSSVNLNRFKRNKDEISS